MKVLQFSGGKDSLACLHLLEPEWADLTVAWVNTGAAFPETIAQMKEIAELVPKFVEIEGEQTIERDGYPVDVLPIASTSIGQQFEGVHGRRFQSRYLCCAAALWSPTQRAMKQLGATIIVRGQKKADERKSNIQSGTVIDGVRYDFPIENWSDQDVLDYLASRGVALPTNYAYMKTGLDCWNCTAYLDENVGKFPYMRQHHPEKYEIVQGVLSDLSQTLHRDLSPLTQIKASYS